MSSGLYSLETKEFDKELDLSRIKPYGDTMNDGKVQLSFTLPVEDGEEAIEAAKQFLLKMGLTDPLVVFHQKLMNGFTFFNCYGCCTHVVDFRSIYVPKIESTTMTMEETDAFIRERIGRKIVVVGASTGTDAHTVGIDAIMNMKGYAGHYGLERYDMFDVYNLGSQVPNETLISKAIEVHADVILASQTVTQKDVHIHNLVNMVELLEAENLRSRILLICGGARISHELAKELGYDAGFGKDSFADDVASYIAEEMAKRIDMSKKAVYEQIG